jgi:Uma2 family endonuclease
MTSVLTKLMTAEEFYDWSQLWENRDRNFELEAGKVIELPMTGELKGFLCANLCEILGSYVHERRAGHVCSNNVGLILARNPDTVFGPDISLFLEASKFRDLEVGWPKNLPKLIVEVMSPNDRMGKMLARIAKFLKKGVAMAWLLDPEDETLTIFFPNREPIVLERDDEVADLKLLPDFRCKVADFFSMPGE